MQSRLIDHPFQFHRLLPEFWQFWGHQLVCMWSHVIKGCLSKNFFIANTCGTSLNVVPLLACILSARYGFLPDVDKCMFSGWRCLHNDVRLMIFYVVTTILYHGEFRWYLLVFHSLVTTTDPQIFGGKYIPCPLWFIQYACRLLAFHFLQFVGMIIPKMYDKHIWIFFSWIDANSSGSQIWRFTM